MLFFRTVNNLTEDSDFLFNTDSDDNKMKESKMNIFKQNNLLTTGLLSLIMMNSPAIQAKSLLGELKPIDNTRPQPYQPFKIKIRTTNPGTSSNYKFEIPTKGRGYYYNVDCDSNGVNEATAVTDNYVCSYRTPGEYTISIAGNFPRIYFNNTKDSRKLLSVEQWGDIKWKSMNHAFAGCRNMIIEASDEPDLSEVRDMSYMLAKTYSGERARLVDNRNPSIGRWNVSQVNNMQGLFSEATYFHQAIGNWDVSNVWDMSKMFFLASKFNHKLDDWDVSNVTNMQGMFHSAKSFNQRLGKWDVSNVRNMQEMFKSARAFNQNLETWKPSEVNNMSYMFAGAISFNQPINNRHWGGTLWQNSSNNMQGMFAGARSFNQPINNWDVSNVINMSYMFANATAFNQPLNNWNVGRVTNMKGMFKATRKQANLPVRTVFNQDISNWDVSNVTDMSNMFMQSRFNQDISTWDVKNVRDMSRMFDFSFFNQAIGNWNVSQVTDMSFMFSNNYSFQQDISFWNVGNVTNMEYMFAHTCVYPGVCAGRLVDLENMLLNRNTVQNLDISQWDVSQVKNMRGMFKFQTLSTENYNQLLEAWSQLPLQDNVTFHAGMSQFSPNYEAAKKTIIDRFGWIFE